MFSIKLWTFALIATTTYSAVADDWPQWGGPLRDCVWHEDGIVDRLPTHELLPRKWSASIGEGYSGPVVGNGRVIVTDRIQDQHNERVLCFDAETGKELWKQEYESRYRIDYPAGPRSIPLIHKGHVYTIGAMGDLLCLLAESGEIVWKKNFPTDFATELPTWGMSSSPLIDGEKLIAIVGGGNGSLVVCFDRLTGAEL